MKHTQRLDYARLAEVMHERGLVELESIREILQQSMAGGMPFAESMVTSRLVSDWELSELVCEIFSLPFVPVDMLDIDPKLAQEMDVQFLNQHGLVPVSRWGQVLVVALPGLVPADVLGVLSAQTDMVILPVVGTVETNRRWLRDQLAAGDVTAAMPGSPAAAAAAAAGAGAAEDPTDWGSLFDDADAAVQLDLDGSGTTLEEVEAELKEFDVDELVVEDPPSLVEDGGDQDGLTLPPAPNFDGEEA